MPLTQLTQAGASWYLGLASAVRLGYSRRMDKPKYDTKMQFEFLISPHFDDAEGGRGMRQGPDKALFGCASCREAYEYMRSRIGCFTLWSWIDGEYRAVRF